MVRRARLPLLQERLILNRFFCRLFGFDGFKGLREQLRNIQQGYAEDGHSHFYHTLQGLQGLQIPRDQLAAYDLRIKGYMERLNRFRTPPIQLLYFQYLAVLFAEIYLDRLFNDRDVLLYTLNAFAQSENKLLPSGSLGFPVFTDTDLNKIAFWMATGSGKTLIMHINLWQYLHYCQGKAQHDNILLITHNEGLSRQHLEEFHKSGIAANHYGEAGGMLFGYGDVPVTVIEITKLTETKRGGGLTVEVDAFGPNNLLFVDEGHRGASGEVWRDLRARVAESGFTFEYSATFGQIVNGASKAKRPALLEEYSKAILFDYSYPHFYHDGYGKDYWILNLKDESDTFNHWMLLGNLLSFYEQCLVYEDHKESFRPYNLEKPLWVFVGHTVTGGKSKQDRASLTDVEQIVAFFDDFLRRSDEWTDRIGKVLSGETGLKNQRDEDLFQDLFPYVKGKGLTASELYDDIVKRVFGAQAGQTLRAVELKAAPGEIGLRVGADSPYFGVINIGDVSGLMKRLEARGLPCEEENISGSLFNRINDADSTVNILVGSRKFMEGWDCYRVSSMGLMKIGMGEGSQIIQLFGRGVRLHGKGNSLKRSTALEPSNAPLNIELLETLNVFGVRANYMAEFRDYLKQEGIETDYEEIQVPIRVQEDFLKRGLQVLRLPEGERFQDKTGVVLSLDEGIRVRLDLRPRLEMAKPGVDKAGEEAEELIEKAGGEDKADLLKELAPLFDWERIYFDLLEFKRVKGFHNLSFTAATLREIVERGNYEVLCPDGQLPPQSYRDLRRAEDITVAVLRKYIAVFYDRQRRAWEQERLQLLPLTQSDTNLAFGSYKVRAKRDFAETVRELVNKADKLYRLDEKRYPHIHFDRHLYQPLLVSDPRIEGITPPGLNEGEKKFVADLREYLQKNSMQFEGKEIFLLRNLTRGKGIGFFEASAGERFYPDFILWVIEDGQQWIAFIDPHGLRYARWKWKEDPKVRLHRDLKALEPELQRHCPNWKVHLTSFIISTTPFDDIRKLSGSTKEEFEQEHVLFQDKSGDYIEKCLNKVFA